MFTPQQIEQIAFGTALRGYNKAEVDAFLEPLTEDYITLYKENALLKSKMKVLVTKLEEYRSNEASMKDAMVNAQKSCDIMVREAEAKCAAMLGEANDAAAMTTKNADALVAAENARVEEAKRAADAQIQEIQNQIRACLQALDRIREAHAPTAETAPAPTAFDFDHEEAETEEIVIPPVEAAVIATPIEEDPVIEITAEPVSTDSADHVADEISASLQALVGTTDEPAPKPEPKHPVSDTTSKFANLKFGRNYDPNNAK